jgi:hypothetical protein
MTRGPDPVIFGRAANDTGSLQRGRNKGTVKSIETNLSCPLASGAKR